MKEQKIKEIKNIADKIEAIIINWNEEKIETKEALWDSIARVLNEELEKLKQ